MLIDIIKKGSTDRSILLRIVDSTDGTPETAVVFNTSGIDLWYRREGAAKTLITEATLSALTDAHSDGGFLHVGDGYYRFDIPDAAFATGANYVDFGGTVTGMVVIGGRVKLVNIDLEDTVRAGLTALPNVASGSAGAIPTVGTGTAQVDLSGGKVLLQATQTGVTIPTVTTVTTTTTLTNAPSDSSGVTTLLSRLTAARAGYLDFLNIGGNVAANADMAVVVNVIQQLASALEADGPVYRFTTNSLENAPTGSGSSPETIAEAVWDFLTASAVEAGSFGELIQSISGGGGASASEIVDALLADTSVEDGVALRGILRAILASTAGVSPAPSGTTRYYYNPSGTIIRVTATVPGNGARTVIVLNV